jgi:hypothetical protein
MVWIEPLPFFIVCRLQRYYTCFETLCGSRDSAKSLILYDALLTLGAGLPYQGEPLYDRAVAPPALERLNTRVNPSNPSACKTHMCAGVSTVPKQLVSLLLADEAPLMARIDVGYMLEWLRVVDEPASSTPVTRVWIAVVPNFHRVITSVA